MVLGTTGESATIDYAEREILLRYVIEQVAGRIPVIAGTGSNSTEDTIRLTKAAADAECRCLLDSDTIL